MIHITNAHKAGAKPVDIGAYKSRPPISHRSSGEVPVVVMINFKQTASIE